MRRMLAALFVLSWFASNANAATLEGVTMPDTYTVDGQVLKLNGMGLRTLTIFNVKVYVAAMYLAAPSHDPQQIVSSSTPKVIRMHFLHSGSKAEVEKEYRLGEQNNCADGSCKPADAADFEKLIAVAPGVNVGDTSTFIFTSSGVRVLANDKQIVAISNMDVAFHLLAGFIGAHPPSEQLRSGLLGLASN